MSFVRAIEVAELVYLLLVILAVAELLYSRPPGWGWWLVSILLVPLFLDPLTRTSPKSIAYRRRINQMKAAAAKEKVSDTFS